MQGQGQAYAARFCAFLLFGSALSPSFSSLLLRPSTDSATVFLPPPARVLLRPLSDGCVAESGGDCGNDGGGCTNGVVVVLGSRPPKDEGSKGYCWFVLFAVRFALPG